MRPLRGSPLRGTLGSSLRSPAEGEGHEGTKPRKGLRISLQDFLGCEQASALKMGEDNAVLGPRQGLVV